MASTNIGNNAHSWFLQSMQALQFVRAHAYPSQRHMLHAQRLNVTMFLASQFHY